MLDEHPNEFDDRNLFLQAVLGVVSAGRRLDEALAPRSPSSATVTDSPWLFCVLGIVAVRERVLSALNAIPPTGRAPAAPAEAEPSARLDELLR